MPQVRPISIGSFLQRERITRDLLRRGWWPAAAATPSDHPRWIIPSRCRGARDRSHGSWLGYTSPGAGLLWKSSQFATFCRAFRDETAEVRGWFPGRSTTLLSTRTNCSWGSSLKQVPWRPRATFRRPSRALRWRVPAGWGAASWGMEARSLFGTRSRSRRAATGEEWSSRPRGEFVWRCAMPTGCA